MIYPKIFYTMKKRIPMTDMSAGLQLQGLTPDSGNTYPIPPEALKEHVACSHYLDKTLLKFIHLHLSADKIFAPNRNEASMILFLIAGTCRVVTSERNESLLIKAGQMIFISAGCHFSALGAPNAEGVLLRFTEFSFCENLTLQSLARQNPVADPLLEPHVIAPPLAIFLKNMIFYTDNQINCAHLQQIKQDECFILMRICYTKEELARIFAPLLCSRDLVLKMKMQRFAAQARTIAELAARCEMTEITMKRKIKALFGIPAYRWMLRQRNRQILFDLRNGVTPKEICFSYDYSSLSNFTAYCKRQFGLSPSQIIKLSDTEYSELQQKLHNESFW